MKVLGETHPYIAVYHNLIAYSYAYYPLYEWRL